MQYASNQKNHSSSANLLYDIEHNVWKVLMRLKLYLGKNSSGALWSAEKCNWSCDIYLEARKYNSFRGQDLVSINLYL